MGVPQYYGTIQIQGSTPNKKSTMQIFLRGDETLARAKFDNIVTAVDGLSLGTLARITWGQVLQTDPTIPTGHVDVKHKGVFTFINVDGVTMSVSVPALDPTTILPNSENLDLENEFVADFVAEMVTGNIVVDSRAIDLYILKSAIENIE